MKKRTITVGVLEQPFLPGDEYIASKYPNDGVFQLADGRFFVKYGTAVMFLCFPAGFNPFSSVMVNNPEPQATQETHSIDTQTFLKALAIAQSPDLALELCK